MTICTANRMFPLFFQLLFLMRERECKYLSSFSLLFIYSINFWWIDVFFRKWKNIISTKVNRQHYGSLETDIICFMEKFVYETGSWTINSECHNGLYKCAVWTLFAKTLSPVPDSVWQFWRRCIFRIFSSCLQSWSSMGGFQDLCNQTTCLSY